MKRRHANLPVPVAKKQTVASASRSASCDPATVLSTTSRTKHEPLPLPSFAQLREMKAQHEKRQQQRQKLGLPEQDLMEGLSPSDKNLYQLIQASNEELANAHLDALKKRLDTSVVTMAKDHRLPNYRRVRFDGIHVLPEFTAVPYTHVWVELAPYSGDDSGDPYRCPFDRGTLMYCTDQLPPLGWSRWIYWQDERCAKDVIRNAIRWDIREGELIDFFRFRERKSALEQIGAAAVIEECRTSGKRLNDEARAASPLQLCLNWNLEECVCNLEKSHQPTIRDIAIMRFTEDGWAVEPPAATLTVANLMLLSKHEVAVLARRPKLAKFLYELCEAELCLSAVEETHSRLDEAQRDAEEAYRSRDLRHEVEIVDLIHPQLPMDPDPSSSWRPASVGAYESMILSQHSLPAGAATEGIREEADQWCRIGSSTIGMHVRHPRLDDSLVTEASDDSRPNGMEEE